MLRRGKRSFGNRFDLHRNDSGCCISAGCNLTKNVKIGYDRWTSTTHRSLEDGGAFSSLAAFLDLFVPLSGANLVNFTGFCPVQHSEQEHMAKFVY
jgi:hypothetical protein